MYLKYKRLIMVVNICNHPPASPLEARMLGDQDDELGPGEQNDQGGDVALGGAGAVSRVRRREE